MSTMLRERLEMLFRELQDKDPKMTPYQVAKLARTNYNNLRDALTGDRSFSDNQLKDLADSGLSEVDYDTLIGWKLADERTARQLEIAAEAKKILETAPAAVKEALTNPETAESQTALLLMKEQIRRKRRDKDD